MAHSKLARKGCSATRPAVRRARSRGASRDPGTSSDRGDRGFLPLCPRGPPSAVGGASLSDPELFPLSLRLLGTWQSGIPRRLVANIGAFRWARLASSVFLRSLTLLGRTWGAPWTQHPRFSLSEVLEQGLSSRHHSQSPKNPSSTTVMTLEFFKELSKLCPDRPDGYLPDSGESLFFTSHYSRQLALMYT